MSVSALSLRLYRKQLWWGIVVRMRQSWWQDWGGSFNSTAAKWFWGPASPLFGNRIYLTQGFLHWLQSWAREATLELYAELIFLKSWLVCIFRCICWSRISLAHQKGHIFIILHSTCALAYRILSNACFEWKSKSFSPYNFITAIVSIYKVTADRFFFPKVGQNWPFLKGLEEGEKQLM